LSQNAENFFINLNSIQSTLKGEHLNETDKTLSQYPLEFCSSETDFSHNIHLHVTINIFHLDLQHLPHFATIN